MGVYQTANNASLGELGRNVLIGAAIGVTVAVVPGGPLVKVAAGAAVNVAGGKYLTEQGLQGFDFFVGTSFGVFKTYGDRRQQQMNKDQTNCYLNHICASTGN